VIGPPVIGIETDKTHPVIARGIAEAAGAGTPLVDVGGIVADLRRVKTPAELATMRQAGRVAVAMGAAGHAAIGEGVPEYEVALAVIAAGTREAAALIEADSDGSDADLFVSPTIYNLQVLQSGRHTCMVHRRSSVRRIERGDPVYLCFCGIANFRHFKLGFDREFWVGSVSDEQARAYETALAAQQAALAQIRPGAIAGEVHAAAEAVYRDAGYGPAYRTGRGIGYSFLETPELKRGDTTRLEAGMTFAVDGGLGVPGRYGARVGDSVAVTETGFEYLTDYPRDLTVI
jgi:Xaa-Pro aminopeptidase